MRKSLYSLVSLLLIISAFYVIYKSIENRPVADNTVIEHDVLGETSSEGTLQVDPYKIAWFEADGSNISLISNFDDRQISADLVEENECTYAINGGFYSKQLAPIGLFIEKSNQLGEYERNKIFNGIFSINRLDTPRVTFEVPRDPLVHAVQTGPVFLANDDYIPYDSATDKQARRMAAIVTGENKVIFAVIYDGESVFNGPQLSEIPSILEEFEEKIGLNFADAINLDGGSASAFYSEKVTLKEISPIGSLFCVKK